jgi:rare lipoprotein A
VFRFRSAWSAFLIVLVAAFAAQAPTARAEMRNPDATDVPPNAHRPASGHRIDLSGRKVIGKASYYANRFAGRKMADGTRMDPQEDNAASKTLPLGTKARVTNLETGQSTTVTIQDRGPYAKGRIVDLSPSTAREIGITRHQGVATVEVAPITVPMPDGSVKPGDAARER